MLYTYVEEYEDKDPVGPRDALELFKEAAVEAGLIRRGDPLDGYVVDFAKLVVEMCASIATTTCSPRAPMAPQSEIASEGSFTRSEFPASCKRPCAISRPLRASPSATLFCFSSNRWRCRRRREAD